MRKFRGWQFLIILVLVGTNIFTYYHLFDLSIKDFYQSDQLKQVSRDRAVLAKTLYETTKGKSYRELKELVKQAGLDVPEITRMGEPVIRLGPLTSFRFKDDKMIAIASGYQAQPLAGSFD